MMNEHAVSYEQPRMTDVASFGKKDWACLVSLEDLERHRLFRDHGSRAGALIATALWRQIELVAMPHGVTIYLGSVNEEASLGGRCSVRHGARTITLAWEDLDDLDGLTRHFEHEQVGVLRKSREMLAALREHVSTDRLILAV
jgi:hypothetical protein